MTAMLIFLRLGRTTCLVIGGQLKGQRLEPTAIGRLWNAGCAIGSDWETFHARHTRDVITCYLCYSRTEPRLTEIPSTSSDNHQHDQMTRLPG